MESIERALGEVATITMGTSPKGDTYNNDGIGLPLLNGPTEFGPSHPDATLFTIDSKRECKPGDLIFCVRGSTTGRMNWADQVYSLGRGVCSFEGCTPLETKFIRYALEWRLPALLQMAGGGTFPNLTSQTIRDFKIPWPENRAEIADILSAYDDLIENNTRRIQILEEMARTIYREWFVHFRYPGHESVPLVDSPIGPVPEGWEVVQFTDIADVLSGGTPKTKVLEYWNGDIPFFTPKDAPDSFYVFGTDKTVTPLGVDNCSSDLFPPETVFITARGTVGKMALNAVDMAMNQSCYALRGKAGITQLFLFFMTMEQVDYLKKNTGGATFDTIVIDTFRRMVVAAPSTDLVARFTEVVRPLLDLSRSLASRNSRLVETRDLLLPQLVSGELVKSSAAD